MAQKILITGGSGFIGKNLVEHLSQTHKVHAPSSQELDLKNVEAVKKYLHKNSFDTVIHAAADVVTRNYHKDRSHVVYNNLLMYMSLSRCHSMFGKMFSFGSGAEYDRHRVPPRVQEESFGTVVPTDEYGFSKYVISHLTETYPNIYNLRLFGCFGQYEAWPVRFISNAICKTLYGMDITIHQNVQFDYLYIKDLALITQWFIEQEKLNFKHYNVCTGKTVSLVDIAEIIQHLGEKDINIRVLKDERGSEYSGNNARLIDELGPFRFTKLESSIKELYEWYKDRLDTIDPNILKEST